ncbi:MAG: aspartate ammonia-lyase, partial [Deltaproteobacteria bacterium]|nr:aspartate ammonia-lyase [Deltaproteobacteria bacterium]
MARLEKDSLGSLPIPDEVYYGIQTERARRNFDISGTPIGKFPELIQALAAIKKAAALANCELGALDRPLADAICSAADEILAGKMADQFPVDIYQGGGGTSTNMNMNEVLANRANELLTGKKGYDRVHPNDQVNLGQSTNDVIPSAMILACRKLCIQLIEPIGLLEKALADKEIAFKDVVKIGRTCLQDALPITLG